MSYSSLPPRTPIYLKNKRDTVLKMVAVLWISLLEKLKIIRFKSFQVQIETMT